MKMIKKKKLGRQKRKKGTTKNKKRKHNKKQQVLAKEHEFYLITCKSCSLNAKTRIFLFKNLISFKTKRFKQSLEKQENHQMKIKENRSAQKEQEI